MLKEAVPNPGSKVQAKEENKGKDVNPYQREAEPPKAPTAQGPEAQGDEEVQCVFSTIKIQKKSELETAREAPFKGKIHERKEPQLGRQGNERTQKDKTTVKDRYKGEKEAGAGAEADPILRIVPKKKTRRGKANGTPVHLPPTTQAR